MEVYFFSLGFKRRPWEVCPSDRASCSPCEAPDIVTEVQGKKTVPILKVSPWVSYTVGSILKSTFQWHLIRVLWIT